MWGKSLFLFPYSRTGRSPSATFLADGAFEELPTAHLIPRPAVMCLVPALSRQNPSWDSACERAAFQTVLYYVPSRSLKSMPLSAPKPPLLTSSQRTAVSAMGHCCFEKQLHIQLDASKCFFAVAVIVLFILNTDLNPPTGKYSHFCRPE